MKTEALLDGTVEWLAGDGADSDVVVACRAVLARNLAAFLFPPRCPHHEKHNVQEQVAEVVSTLSSFSSDRYYAFEELEGDEQRFLVERELADEELSRVEGPRGVWISESQSSSIAVNGVEHLRLRALVSGLEPQKTWSIVNKLEGQLATSLDFAYHEQFGFLTSSTAMVGTGLRLTVLLHLPALTMASKVLPLEQRLREGRHRLEGVFGSVNERKGSLYALSNMATLGQSEEEMVFHLRHAADEAITQERSFRENLLSKGRLALEDQVGRALGLVRGVRLLELDEALGLLSSLRLGVTTGLLTGYDLRVMNELLVWSRPAHIRLRTGNSREAVAESATRAELFRSYFAKV